ncbi:MAG: hypothetical protein N2C14_27130 [Planctomycetales bacterium]
MSLFTSVKPAATRKETIEYDEEFLKDWNHFCDSKGFSKRQAAHAARIAFMMMLNAEQREGTMSEAMPFVTRSRKRRMVSDVPAEEATE